ncbi:hypothetical protein [Lactobacillus helveticus]|uniref:Uncharacterized protein n=1 Tax=Lactobacillus helveticus TaxID=1587 RepID=A0A8H9F984_LACHE|nr:hypothetical protein [Lactobacillus helveticus]KRO14720.1 hypothetical protein IV62_GL000878 [Lactobacillus helveticus]MBW8060901.1 hypothetical protein [Lactobacillus helveticus]GFO99912.1 hypothetical protein LHEH8_16680 [Lactobacillus helveticus]GFP00183.1 hypothetical protein LHEW6_00160 [Lactobacillus helveticus]GFP02444.1 hypothetical protein LHEY10_03730 [Lactobacillus helveticus]
MTAKKNFDKKKINKNRKELTPKAKKTAVGTASVLLGASLMGNAKPIKKIVGGKREDDISLVVKADTIEGTEESSDVITSAGQEDQVAEIETMPVEEETTVNDDTQTSAVAEQVDDEIVAEPQDDTTTVETDAVPASDGQTETQETETNTTVSATTNVDDQNQDIAVGEPPRDEEGKDPTHNELVDKVEQTNKDSETEIHNAVNDLLSTIDDAYKAGLTITSTGETKEFHATAANIDDVINQLKDYNADQIKEATEKIKNQIEQYQSDLNKYEEAKAAYIAELVKLGLWDEKSHTDPDTILQDLVLDKTDQTIVSVETMDKNHVQESNGSILGFLDKLYTVSGDVEGDLQQQRC